MKNPWLASSNQDTNTKNVNIRCWKSYLKFTQKQRPGLHWGYFAVLGEIEEELAYFGFTHLYGRAHEILGKVPDASQVGSGGVRAVPFEQEIGLHLFL